MSAETLRRAAALIRKRADKATTGDAIRGDHWHHDLTWMSKRFEVIATDEGSIITENLDRWTAEHIASWHPAVALAVADWLDATYAEHEEIGVMRAVTPSQIAARAVARTYLGEAS